MKILLVLVLFALSQGNEFIISYKAMIRNQILFGEKYYVSKTLRTSKHYEVLGECEFMDSSDINEDSSNYLLLALRNNKEAILECFSKNTSAIVRDDVKYINNEANTKTYFTIEPHRVIAKNNNGNIKIKIIREDK